MSGKRNYKVEISWKDAQSLLSFADSKCCPISCFEGCLLDNYVIYNAKCIAVNKSKPRKFIILQEKYLNSWSSGIILILTDDEKQVEDFVSKFEEKEND